MDFTSLGRIDTGKIMEKQLYDELDIALACAAYEIQRKRAKDCEKPSKLSALMRSRKNYMLLLDTCPEQQIELRKRLDEGKRSPLVKESYGTDRQRNRRGGLCEKDVVERALVKHTLEIHLKEQILREHNL